MSKEESSGEDAAAVSDTPTDAPPKDPNADVYENRPKKIIRVVTVMAYLFSVSFAAILLSTYYIFLWEPPNPRLIERERLRADSEMQFLFADAPSFPPARKKADLDHKPLQGRVIDYPDDNPDEANRAKLNTMLTKLRYSLVEIMRAQNGSRSSLESAIPDDLFVTVEKMLNSTKRVSREKDSKYDKNVPGEETRSDAAGSPPGLENSTSVGKYKRNRTSRLFSPANVANFQQNHSFGMNHSNKDNPPSNQTERIIARGRVSIELSSPRGSKFADDLPGFRHSDPPPDDPPAVVKPWLYATRNSEVHFFWLFAGHNGPVDSDFPMMQLPRKMSAHNVMASIGRTLGKSDSKPSATNEIRFAGDGRKDKLYEPKHKQKLVRVLTVIAYVIFVSLAAILLSLYYTFVWNPKDQAVRKRIDKPECSKPPLNLLTIPPISNETQIERMTAKSTTIDIKQPENANLLTTTQRQKDLPTEIPTEITTVEKTSVELTSVSTMRDYRGNFTSVANNAVGGDVNNT